jgi:hypothetical protein
MMLVASQPKPGHTCTLIHILLLLWLLPAATVAAAAMVLAEHHQVLLVTMAAMLPHYGSDAARSSVDAGVHQACSDCNQQDAERQEDGQHADDSQRVLQARK